MNSYMQVDFLRHWKQQLCLVAVPCSSLWIGVPHDRDDLYVYLWFSVLIAVGLWCESMKNREGLEEEWTVLQTLPCVSCCIWIFSYKPYSKVLNSNHCCFKGDAWPTGGWMTGLQSHLVSGKAGVFLCLFLKCISYLYTFPFQGMSSHRHQHTHLMCIPPPLRSSHYVL